MRKHPVNLPGLKPAPFWKRFLALLVDMLLLALITRAWLLVGFGVLPGRVLGILLLVSMVLRFVYFPLGHGLWGRTPGKRLMGIRMIRGAGEPMSLWPGFLREIFSWPGFVMNFMVLVALWARLDEPGSFRQYQRLFSAYFFENFRTLAPLLIFGSIILGTLSFLFFWMNPDRRIPHDYLADTFVCLDPESDS